MILLFIFFFLAKAEIRIPLLEKSQPLRVLPNPSPPFSLRGLSSSVTMINLHNSQYYVEVGIGTPYQNFSLSLSLETSWIFIDQIKCSQCRKWTNKFDPSQSTTFKKDNNEWNMDAVEKMQGNSGRDTVGIGTLSVDSQGVFLIDSEYGMNNLGADGILGLGFSQEQDVSILKTLHDQNGIENMVFSLYLNDINTISDLPDKGQSMLIIDGHDIYKYAVEKEFTYISVVKSGKYWEMSFDKVILGVTTFKGGNKAIISPGEKGILGPKEVIDGILQQLQSNASCYSNSMLICKCDANYPDIVIQINGTRFRIKSAGYLEKLNTGCSLIFGYSTITDTWILGDAFLRRFYTLYDMENKKIGFATIGAQSQIEVGSGSQADDSGKSNSMENWKLAIIIAIPIPLLIIIIGFIFACIWKKRNHSCGREDNDSSKEECKICNKRFSISLLKTLQCGHIFCKKDLRKNIQSCIKENLFAKALRCPLNSCKKEIKLNFLLDILPKSKWDKLNFFLITSDFRIIKCPNCSEKFNFYESRKAKCKKCGHTFCTECNENWHDNGDCQETWVLITIRNLIAKLENLKDYKKTLKAGSHEIKEAKNYISVITENIEEYNRVLENWRKDNENQEIEHKSIDKDIPLKKEKRNKERKESVAKPNDQSIKNMHSPSKKKRPAANPQPQPPAENDEKEIREIMHNPKDQNSYSLAEKQIKTDQELISQEGWRKPEKLKIPSSKHPKKKKPKTEIQEIPQRLETPKISSPKIQTKIKDEMMHQKFEQIDRRSFPSEEKKIFPLDSPVKNAYLEDLRQTPERDTKVSFWARPEPEIENPQSQYKISPKIVQNFENPVHQNQDFKPNYPSLRKEKSASILPMTQDNQEESIKIQKISQNYEIPIRKAAIEQDKYIMEPNQRSFRSFSSDSINRHDSNKDLSQAHNNAIKPEEKSENKEISKNYQVQSIPMIYTISEKWNKPEKEHDYRINPATNENNKPANSQPYENYISPPPILYRIKNNLPSPEVCENKKGLELPSGKYRYHLNLNTYIEDRREKNLEKPEVPNSNFLRRVEKSESPNLPMKTEKNEEKYNFKNKAPEIQPQIRFNPWESTYKKPEIFTNDQSSERSFNPNIQLNEQKDAIVYSQPGPTFQSFFNSYSQKSSIYLTYSYKGNKTKLIAYNTDIEKEEVKVLETPESLDCNTSIAKLPEGGLFCFGNKSSSGTSLIVNKNCEIRVIPSGTPCIKSSAIYLNRNVYCFGGIKKHPLTLSQKFNLDENKWTQLSPMPQADCRCSCIEFKNFILISGYFNKNILRYSLDLNNFARVPFDFSENKIKLLISVERLYLIECEGKIYESEVGDEATWKHIANSIARFGHTDQVCCVNNKSMVYIGGNFEGLRYYFKFDLDKKVMIKLQHGNFL